ncbi:hypothetical protein PRZ48_003810 [Zasmidium cellare]|uniref:Uncharacterized protein n=1 Tax=Zasmidium cellare TaxID=395010 RepID=A0ABR0EXQ3_ZASCE|nr:hypothetical protein PRZ48_003810 [Zasmidium cellare]
MNINKIETHEPEEAISVSRQMMTPASVEPVGSGKKRTMEDLENDAADEVAGKRKKQGRSFDPPGDLTTLEGHYEVFHRESTCAAYLGFTDIGDLRRFIVTHYFLDHFLRFKTDDKWSSHLNAHGAFKEIEDWFLNQQVETNKYPVSPQDRPRAAFKLHPGEKPKSTNSKALHEYTTAKKTALAYILILMVEDLDGKVDSSVDRKSQKAAQKRLKKTLPYVQSLVDITGATIKFPRLKTAFVELEIEPFNRAMVLLRYAQEMLSSTNWKRISRMPPNFTRAYQKTDVPGWMQQHPVVDGLARQVDNNSSQGEDVPALRQSLPSERSRKLETIDLTSTSEDEAANVGPKQEISDEEEPLEPNLASTNHEAVADNDKAVTSKLASEDEGSIQSKLKVAKLQLKIELLEQRLAASQKGKRT